MNGLLQVPCADTHQRQANAAPALFHLHTLLVCITHWHLLESNGAFSAAAQSARQTNTARDGAGDV